MVKICLTPSCLDLQATSQTDLENWVTAIHSASASLLVKRQGKEDTLRLLRSQSRSLLHKIDMDGKMKKMAELQLSIIKEPKSRKAVESQVSAGRSGPVRADSMLVLSPTPVLNMGNALE